MTADRRVDVATDSLTRVTPPDARVLSSVREHAMTRLALALALAVSLPAIARAEVAGAWSLVAGEEKKGSLTLSREAPGVYRATLDLDGRTRSGTARREGEALKCVFPPVRGIVELLPFEERPEVPELRCELRVARGERWGEERLEDPTGQHRLEPVWETRDLAELSPEAEQYAKERAGEVCVAVRDPRRRTVWVLNPETRIRTASIVKMAVMAAVMHRANEEGRDLTQAEVRDIGPMIRVSDNDATTRLFNSLGKGPGLARFFEKAGMTATKPHPMNWWGYTDTTAPDMARLAALVYERDLLGVGMSDRALEWLSNIAASQSWGLEQGSPPEAFVAFKNGWYPEDESGVWRVNSVGAVRQTEGADVGFALAVLTRYPIGRGQGYGERTTTEVTRLVHAALAARDESSPDAEPEPAPVPRAPEDGLPLPGAPPPPPPLPPLGEDASSGSNALERLLGLVRSFVPRLRGA